MLRRSELLFHSRCRTRPTRHRPTHYEYRRLNRWQREASGLSRWKGEQSHRPTNARWKHRFNPEAAHNTKGTPENTYMWLYKDQTKLPQVAPEDYKPPERRGRDAWPDGWFKNPEKWEKLLTLNDEKIRKFCYHKLQQVIHDATQEDGYELRTFNMDNEPVSNLPTISAIKDFILEEETLRDRVIEDLVENEFGFVPDSESRKEMRTVENVIRFILVRLETCREKLSFHVPHAVKEFLQEQRIQPELGFHHALPQDERDRVVIEWERSFHHDWQFGKAVYKPRDKERTRGNQEWMRMAQQWREYESTVKDIESGKAEAEHRAKIEAAAQ